MVSRGVKKTELLHNGHFANAVVWKHWLENGEIVVEKDFSSRFWLIRNTIGRSLIRREVKFLHAVDSIGVVPGGSRRCGPFSMVENFCEGVTLRQMIAYATGNHVAERVMESPRLFALLSSLNVDLFKNLESALKQVHKMGIVHLDLHNARNIIRTSESHCVIIDWQSATHTGMIPRPIRRMLEAIDLAGVYKHWEKLCPGTLGPQRERILDWENRRRKLWLLRGLKIDAPAVKKT